MRAAVFLDRDGVIIENRRDHVKSWAEVGSWTCADARLAAAGPVAAGDRRRLQPGRRGTRLARLPVCLGHCSERSFARSSRAAGGSTPATSARIIRTTAAPAASPSRGCCGKPPAIWAWTSLRSWLVGDAAERLAGAQAAGVRGILVRSGRGSGTRDPASSRDGTSRLGWSSTIWRPRWITS